jgi:hypothetical protein
MILHIVNVKFSPFLYNLKPVYKDKHSNVIIIYQKSIHYNISNSDKSKHRNHQVLETSKAVSELELGRLHPERTVPVANRSYLEELGLT